MQSDYQAIGEYNGAAKVLINRGGTTIERWINSQSDLFGEAEIAAIRYCQRLWAILDSKTTPDPSYIKASVPGLREHEALSELSLLKRKFPSRMWSCYENICRFDMDAPTAGSDMAGNRRSAGDAAKTTVANVASIIAGVKGYA